ncbi:hypothetical protein P8452_53493 [Trifolium repens]|nr:hypothetical protein P8452_53493 [Trifolium repens]
MDITAFSRSEDDSDEIKSSGLTSQQIPNFKEVEFLLTNLCDTDSIAELELKLEGFHLRVVRDLTEKTKTLPPPSLATPAPYSVSTDGFLDKAADEGLVIIKSPRVGFFRRSRTIKGKCARPSCEEMQIVKEGQVICYIEQLGGQLPIESDVSGEVIKILREDGDPVGYGDTLIAILPSFPGIKKLQ